MHSAPPIAVQRLTERLYGSAIVRNSARGELVEEIVAMALEPQWRLGGDWDDCDLRHEEGLRMQVKQSAARQSWHTQGDAPSRGGYQTAYKKGRYLEDGKTWLAERCRNADIFVFAWHPGVDDTADHRLPEQWRFFVMTERDLPPTESLSLSSLRRLAAEIGFSDLKQAVEAATTACR